MAQFYSDPTRATDPHALPDVEVFHIDAQQAAFITTEDGTPAEIGWYYWACFPGCLPDSEPFGPFATEAEAIEAAQDEAGS